MKIRTVHHLSATGGTMISHVIAAQQDVYLLSELNPTSQIARTRLSFAPIDPFQQFGAQYGHLSLSDYTDEFLRRLRPVSQIVAERAGYLVIRDHSHSDWLLKKCMGQSMLIAALQVEYEVQSIVTVRHPIEAYASMRKSNWHSEVGTFDAYCERVLAFLDYFTGIPHFRYEDFVMQPGAMTRRICASLDIPFSQDWATRYRAIELTGDSGRGGREKMPIQPLPVASIDDELRREVTASRFFEELATRLDYVTCADELARQRQQQILLSSVKSGITQSDQADAKA